MTTITQKKALQRGLAAMDHAPKQYLKPAISLRRVWIEFRILIAAWEISGCDNSLFRMHAERDHVNDEISKEMKVRCELVDRVRELRGRL